MSKRAVAGTNGCLFVEMRMVVLASPDGSAGGSWRPGAN